MPIKKPATLKEAIHIDDFMERKRNLDKAVEELVRSSGTLEERITELERIAGEFTTLERRVGEMETAHDTMENTMNDLKTSLHTVEKAIIGDIEHPEMPGMAENVRSLVEMHKEEKKAAPSGLSGEVPWKAIVMALGIIGGLVWIIMKMVPA